MSKQERVLQCKLDTLEHIRNVQDKMAIFIRDLQERATKHDLTKLESPELEIFAEFGGELGKVEYGSAEYQELLNKVKPATDHHYAKNRHHSEHYPNGINGMSLLDLVEMLADWFAATKRNANGNIRKSIEHNKKRYGISDQLTEILENTVREYFD